MTPEIQESPSIGTREVLSSVGQQDECSHIAVSSQQEALNSRGNSTSAKYTCSLEYGRVERASEERGYHYAIITASATSKRLASRTALRSNGKTD